MFFGWWKFLKTLVCPWLITFHSYSSLTATQAALCIPITSMESRSKRTFIASVGLECSAPLIYRSVVLWNSIEKYRPNNSPHPLAIGLLPRPLEERSNWCIRFNAQSNRAKIAIDVILLDTPLILEKLLNCTLLPIPLLPIALSLIPLSWKVVRLISLKSLRLLWDTFSQLG